MCHLLLAQEVFAHVTLFHGVNQELFHSLRDAKLKEKRWLWWHSEKRPRSSLGYLRRKEFEERVIAKSSCQEELWPME